MKKYDIIVIDCGYFGEYECIDCIDLCRSNSSAPSSPSEHGTIITDIIIDNAPPTASILSLKITDDQATFSEEDLLFALQFIYEKQLRSKIINISLGIVEATQILNLKNLVKQLLDTDCVIISAMHPLCYSYPAAFSNVISVDVSESIRFKEHATFDRSELNITYPNQSVKRITKSGAFFDKGASYWCAQLSGTLLSYFEKHAIESGFLDAAQKYLSQSYEKTLLNATFPNVSGSSFVKSIKKAILFPFNKETRAIISNQDLLSFDITGIFDFDISLNKGKKVEELISLQLNNPLKNIRIGTLKNLNWSSDFDTLILGHIAEYEHITATPLLPSIIELCREHRKRLYSFDPLPVQSSTCFNCFDPNIRSQPSFVNPTGKLFSCGIPVVFVAGTSSVQGKFFLQLELRRQLQLQGYQVSNIGTEPSGYLFGFDTVFPIGYNSLMQLTPFQFISLVNHSLHSSECFGNDIAIIGSQSGTIPDYVNNLSYYPIFQYQLLIGANPDAIILCVNAFDSYERIERTLSFLQGATCGEILCLFLSPLDSPYQSKSMRDKRPLLSKEVTDKSAKELQNKFNIPVFSIYSPPESLTKFILDYFS